jgi:hypothetical protein
MATKQDFKKSFLESSLFFLGKTYINFKIKSIQNYRENTLRIARG